MRVEAAHLLALEGSCEGVGQGRLSEINETVSEVRSVAVVHRKVKKVEIRLGSKPCICQLVQQHLLPILVRQVPHHDSGHIVPRRLLARDVVVFQRVDAAATPKLSPALLSAALPQSIRLCLKGGDRRSGHRNLSRHMCRPSRRRQRKRQGRHLRSLCLFREVILKVVHLASVDFHWLGHLSAPIGNWRHVVSNLQKRVLHHNSCLGLRHGYCTVVP
mmetsp:Transcript_10688/g.25206  ORF Transcript_10688/g.25206 Transcript_10688/m.25206 type:complete len:217 (-) Transcript_10688:73-723(-)